MGTMWEDEARKALHMELIEQYDRTRRELLAKQPGALRKTLPDEWYEPKPMSKPLENRLRDTRIPYLCVCGECDEVEIKNFTGDVVRTYLDGPCGRRMTSVRVRRPQAVKSVAQPAPRALGGWNGVTGAVRVPLDDAIRDLDTIHTRDVPGTDVEIWRSLWFGWHGRLYAGHSTLDRWWRPWRRFAEYRGSFVLLRYLEHRDREALNLAGY